MTVCPQCGYERKSNDDNFVSAEECPKCGIYYKKWTSAGVPNDTEPLITNSEGPNVNKENKKIRYKRIISAAIIVAVLAIFVKFTFLKQTDSPQFVLTLPVIPILKSEGRSYIIHAIGNEDTITAAGQIFKPPEQTPVLFKLGFLFTQSTFTQAGRDSKFRVILSEWYGDHPSPTALWVSEPTIVPSNNESFKADWFDFDVPHLLLNPSKLYIAWITLSGVGNQSDGIIGISYASKTGDSSPYPEGMYTFYKQENPYGDVSQITNSSWEVYDVGSNLHFRMSFENLKNDHNKIVVKNDAAENRLNEIIQKKTHYAIVERRNMEQQKREEIRQNQSEWDMIQQQKENERRQAEYERQQEERSRQQAEYERQQEERSRQQVEREIQQYDQEKRQEDARQKQQDIMRQPERNRLYYEPRRVQRIPRRR